MKKKIYKNINEVVYHTTLKNKMKVYLLYKPGFSEKTAFIATKFGHFDSVRYIKINDKNIKIPYGAAHFLEHRMFSIDDVDASELFSLYGAQCNAYTTYEKTAYYFSTQTNFYKCLEILLKMMDSFTSTDKQIENEKSIIIQEMKMYQENPSHLLNSTAFKEAYIKHPINHDIIGNLKSIKKTDVNILKAIFDTFYDPSNLTLVVCGDINHIELEDFLNSHLLSVKNQKKISPIKINEPPYVKNEYKEIYLPTIKMERLALIYKLEAIKNKKEKDKMYFCYNLILDYLFSSSGKLSEKWLQDGIISTLLDYSISSNIDLDCIIFYNINTNIDNLIKNIKEVFDSSKEFNMTEDEFNDLKKTHFGATIRAYESVMSLSSYYVADLFTSSSDFFDEVNEVKNLTLNDMKVAFKKICNAATSLIVLKGE